MESNKGQWVFEGFRSPNFTSVPDEFFDQLLPRLSGGEVKVLLYIIRRTFGFKKPSDSISMSQMVGGIVKKSGERLDYGAGVSKPSLCRALKSLEDKGVIIRTRQFDFREGYIATCYQVRMFGAPLTTEKNPTLGKKMRQGGSQNLTKPLVKKRDIQYTVNNIQLDNNVNVVSKGKKGKNILHGLTDSQQDTDHVRLIADDILASLGDNRSEKFYLLVARKVPEEVIRRRLSELKEGGVKSPARVFTSQMMKYAEEATPQRTQETLDGKAALAKKYTGNDS